MIDGGSIAVTEDDSVSSKKTVREMETRIRELERQLVKVSDANKAAQVYRETIRQYCRSMGGLDVLVPLSFTLHKTVTDQPSFKPEELIGNTYPNSR